MPLRLLATLVAALLLAGCEIPGIYPDPRAVQREADARATGGGCRHAMRGPEDCFTLNPKAPRAAVFAGWKDMDQYMRENKIEGARTTAPATAPTEEEQAAVTGKDKPDAREPRRGGRERAS